MSPAFPWLPCVVSLHTLLIGSPGPLDVVTAAIYFLLQLHNERQINMFPDMAPYTIGGVLAFRVRIVVTHAWELAELASTEAILGSQK